VIGGRYKITKKLGQGGMGSVYLAEHVGVGQRVAIKFLNPNFSGDPDIVRRFLNEAKSYGQVSHPHAVHLHDFGQDDEGALYISMEFIEGSDLKKLLEKEGRLRPRDAIDIALQVCDVLGYAHEKGIVHRDLKPENIMLQKGLRGFHAKVLDFGVARLMEEQGTRLTAAGTITGTPRYMSPEQAEGRDVDRRSDVYALGIVLFELLSGRHPYPGTTITEILRAQVLEPMPHLDASLGLPGALDEVIQRATAKNREERFGTMAEFARALSESMPTDAYEAFDASQAMAGAQTMVKGAAVEKTSHKASPYDRQKQAGGNRTGLYAGIGAAALLLAGGAVALLGPSRPPQPAPNPTAAAPAPSVTPPVAPPPAQPPVPQAPVDAAPANNQAAIAELRAVADKGQLDLARSRWQAGELELCLANLEQIREESAVAKDAEELRQSVAEVQ
ncbi:MAG: serine/threonine-protein kinase, partial [Myxococcales bacterium]